MVDNSNLIYNDLLDQYNSLSDEEKNAILIYKSSFFYHINIISSISDFENKTAYKIYEEIIDKEQFNKKFESYKEIINYSQNMLVKYSVFKSIDMSNTLMFIESMKETYFILKNAFSKIKLRGDIEVYRGISVKDGDVVDKVAKSKFISTSINVDDANDYIYQSGFDESHLFVLSLKKDINALVSPLSLVFDYDDSISMLYRDTKRATLKVARRGTNGQQEIILFGDNLVLDTLSINEIDVGEKTKLYVHKINVDTVSKNNMKFI